MGVPLWPLTVSGMEMGVRTAAGSPTVFLLAWHSCEDVCAVDIYVEMTACNSQRLWSCARSHVVVGDSRRRVPALRVRADAVRCRRGGLAHSYCVTIVTLYAERGQPQRRRCFVAVACGYFGNFPTATAVGCPVAVFASFAAAVALATDMTVCNLTMYV